MAACTSFPRGPATFVQRCRIPKASCRRPSTGLTGRSLVPRPLLQNGCDLREILRNHPHPVAHVAQLLQLPDHLPDQLGPALVLVLVGAQKRLHPSQLLLDALLPLVCLRDVPVHRRKQQVAQLPRGRNGLTLAGGCRVTGRLLQINKRSRARALSRRKEVR